MTYRLPRTVSRYKALTLLVLLLLVAAATIITEGVGHHRALVRAGAFAGVWEVASANTLTIPPDGTGRFAWQTHNYCGTGPYQVPPPNCDGFLVGGKLIAPPVVHGAELKYGGSANLELTSVRGSVATGIVTDTVNSSVIRNGPMDLRLLPNDTLQLDTRATMLFNTLCGAAAAETGLQACGK